MEKQIRRYKHTIITLIACLFCFPQLSSAQSFNFNFTYTGPDTIFVDNNCEATLDWGHPSTVIVTSNINGGMIDELSVSSIEDNLGNNYPPGTIPPTATFNAGTTATVTYYMMDNFGNEAFIGFEIDFVDGMAPAMTAPADITVSCDIPTAPTVTATDNCDGSPMVVFSEGIAPGCAGGTLTRTWTATDASGNSSSVTQSVIMEEDTAPSFTAAFLASVADVTVECDAIPAAILVTAADIEDDCTAGGDITIVDNALELAVTNTNCPIVSIITRTWLVQDECNNEALHSQIITVQDNSGPSITPPTTTDVVIQCTGVPSAPITQIMNWSDNLTVNDNCNTVIWSNDFSGLTGGCGGTTGTATVTYTADDGCNTDAITINFTVQDSNPPNILMGAADITVECDGAGNINDLNTWLANRAGAVASDVCTADADLSLSVRVTSDLSTDDPSIALANALANACASGTLATITVEFAYTDLCGFTSTTDADFVVTDTQEPTFAVPPMNQSIACATPADINTAFSDWYNNAGGAVPSDGCSAGNGSFRGDPDLTTALGNLNASQSTSCGNTGTVDIDFYVSDACGNENPTPFTVSFTINDITAPTWDADPSNLSLECDGTVDPGGLIADWLMNNGGGSATDVCSGVTITNDYTALSDDCGATGTVVVTFTATDDCDNESTRTATITISDTVAPVWTTTPTDIALECDGTSDPGNAIANWLATNGGGAVSDACGTVSVSNDYGGTSDGCGSTGSILVTFTAEDQCGNQTPTTATITITDNEAPTIDVAAADITIECTGNGNPPQLNAWLNTNGGAEASDNCGTVSWSNDFNSLANSGCSGTGSTTVTFTASDPCGMTVTTSAVVTIADTNPPTIDIAAQDVTVECESPSISFTDWLNSHAGASASDACDLIDNSVGSTNWSYATLGFVGACGNSGSEQVIFTVTDDCGNAVTSAATYTIVDNVSPEIIPTSTSITEACGGGDDQTNLENWITNIAGAMTSDGCGNVFWVGISWIDSNGSTGTGAISGPYPVVQSNNCNWSVEVTFTSQDECLNTSTTTSTFSITDTTDPVLLGVPADLTVECSNVPTAITLFANDECDNDVLVTMEEALIDGTCTDNYTITRTWTATDDCGNTDVATQTILVQDTAGPQLVGVPAFVTVNCESIPPAPSIGTDITATDNCDTDVGIEFEEVSSQTSTGFCSDFTYTITRTWTATDNCGNTNAAVQVIMVEDITSPTFTVPADITISCAQNPTDLSITGDVTDEADNCDPTLDATFADAIAPGTPACPQNQIITRTWTLQDACANTTVHVQTILIQDITDPILGGIPGDITVGCNDVPAPPTIGTDITATDNCDSNVDVVINESSTQNGDPNNCDYYNYVLTRTWTATDNCGNTSSGVQVITVDDINAPIFEYCPSNLFVNSSEGTDMLAGDCAAAVTFDLPIVTDDCARNTTCTGSDIQNITGAVDANTLVDNVVLNIGVAGPPTVATSSATLTIDLNNIDAEFATVTEYFTVFGEDGSNLGQTALSPTQCGSSTTTITIPQGTFNLWALDGNIEITLIPFDPPGTANDNEGINNICTNSTVEGTVSYACTTPPSGLVFEYTLDGGSRTPIATPFPSGITEMLPVGTTNVTMYATDCSGNEANCSFNITVIDDEVPTIVCPTSYTVPSPGCSSQDVSLARPNLVNDNCGFSDFYSMNSGTANLSFQEHPNIDGFIANDVALNFTGTVPPAIGNATLTVYIKGDFDDPASEFFTIIGENGATIGVTSVGMSCGGFTPTTFSIPVATILNWAADGVINISAQANQTAGITFGNDGDWNNDDQGINPCVPAGTFDGTEINVNDGGNSQVYAELMFPATTISYTVSGPTNIGTTAFPSDGSDPTITLNPGLNSVTYQITDMNGNTGSCTFNITVGSPTLVTPNIIATTTPSCPGEAVTLVENTGYAGTAPSWVWYQDIAPAGPGGGDFVVATTTSPTVTFPSNAGQNNYYVIIVDQSCSSPNSNSITIDAGDAVVQPFIYAAPNPVCEGSDFTLFLDNPQPSYTSYQWTGPNGYTSTSQFPPTITNAQTFHQGNYTLAITTTDGCLSSYTIFVAVYEQPEQPSISSNSPICDGGDLVLTSSTICDSYLWIGPDGSSAGTLSNPLLNTTTNTTTIPAGNTAYDPGVWTVICVDDFGCQSEESNSVNVLINNPVSLAPTNNGPICAGEDIEIYTGTVAGASYSWTGPNGFMATVQNPIIANATSANAGTYTLTVTDPVGCVGTATTSINVQAAPIVTAVSNSGTACATGAEDILLSATVFPPDDGTYVYQWVGPNGFTSASSSPLLPNGTTLDNGSYTVVVTNENDCSSSPATTVVNVSDAPTTPTISTSAPLCEGDLLMLTTTGYTGSNVVYTWETPVGTVTTAVPSLTITSVSTLNGGDYSVSVNVDGCDSNESGISTVIVNAIPVTPLASSNSPVCEGGTIELQTTFIADATYAWTGPGGFTSSVFNPVIFPATATNTGAYSVSITTNGCTSSFSFPVNVVVNPAPTPPAVESNGAICIDDTNAELTLSIVSATATPGAMYIWYDAATNVQVAGPTSALSVTMTDFAGYTEGTYSFYAVAVLNDCSSIQSVPTLVEINTIPENEAFAGSDIQVCNDLTVNLDADAPTIGSGVWTQTGGAVANIVNPSASNTSVTGLATGETYTFMWTISNGACGAYDSDEVSVTVDATSDMANAGANIQECNVTIISLNAEMPLMGATGTWSQSMSQSNLGVVITNPNDPNTTVSGLVPGNVYTFTWTLSSVSCGEFSNDDVIVTIGEGSIAYAGADFSACGEGDASLMADASATNGTWSSPDAGVTIVSPNQANTVVFDLQGGNNIFIWSVDNGPCGTSADTVIVDFELSSLANGDIATVPFGGSVLIDVTSNDELPSDYIVNIINSPTDGTLDVDGNGQYTYTPNNSFGGTDEFTYELCSVTCPDVCSTARVSITVEDAECVIPTIITPNNDGVNDSFIIPCLATDRFPDNEVAIFNQWGDEVYRSKPYLNNWQGTYNGEDLPVGTYFFIADFQNGEEPESGFLIIER